MKEEKTLEVDDKSPIHFLGCLITPSEITDAPRPRTTEEVWRPVFKEDWHQGKPVYLTSICRGACSRGPHLVIKGPDNKEEHLPWSSVGRIIVVGRSHFSGGVVYRAVKEKIPVTFIDIMGRTHGHLNPENNDELPDITSLQKQYADNEPFCLSLACEVVSAKIHNSFVLLKRNAITSHELKELRNKVKKAANLNSLLGFEGIAARTYFSELAKLTDPFEFKERVFHPPDGPVNAMLSFGYTLLYNRIASVLKDKGFNPRIGFYHKRRGTHAALASDLMEELRHIAERIILTLIHRHEIKPEDFITTQRKELTICRLKGEGFRAFIRQYEITMSTEFTYRSDGKKLSYNSYLDEMSDNLKRAMKLNIPYKALRID